MSQSPNTSSLHRSFSQVPWAEVIGMLGTLQSITPTRVEFSYHGRYFQIGDNGGEINIHEMVPACGYSIPYEGARPLESEDLAGMIVAALNGEPPSWHPIPSQSTPGPLDLDYIEYHLKRGASLMSEAALDLIAEVKAARLRPPAPPAPELRERLAELCHEQWSGWMKYLFEKCEDIQHPDGEDGEMAVVIPAQYVYRWGRQLQTPYERLSEEEKDSDRKEADRILALVSPPPSPAVLDALTWTRGPRIAEWLRDVDEWEVDDNRGAGEALDFLMEILEIIRPDIPEPRDPSQSSTTPTPAKR